LQEEIVTNKGNNVKARVLELNVLIERSLRANEIIWRRLLLDIYNGDRSGLQPFLVSSSLIEVHALEEFYIEEDWGSGLSIGLKKLGLMLRIWFFSASNSLI